MKLILADFKINQRRGEENPNIDSNHQMNLQSSSPLCTHLGGPLNGHGRSTRCTKRRSIRNVALGRRWARAPTRGAPTLASRSMCFPVGEPLVGVHADLKEQDHACAQEAVGAALHVLAVCDVETEASAAEACTDGQEVF